MQIYYNAESDLSRKANTIKPSPTVFFWKTTSLVTIAFGE